MESGRRVTLAAYTTAIPTTAASSAFSARFAARSAVFRTFLQTNPPTELLATLREEFEQLSPMQRGNLIAPLASRLRGVLSRSFAQELQQPQGVAS